MNIEANSPEEYISKLPEERKEAVAKLREVISQNLPNGFKEEMSYGMIGYVVPHSLYPDGYHVDPKLPLPFVNIASQKNHIAVYHMGVYAFDDILKWFEKEYAKQVSGKLDMGKSCIRFKNVKKIPFGLIGELCAKITPDEWIKRYEANVKS